MRLIPRHTNEATGEPCDCRRVFARRKSHVLDAAALYIFDDLDAARSRAINKQWSMECDWICEQVAVLVELGGARLPDPGSVSLDGHLYTRGLEEVALRREWFK